jgi:hypothetical protein
LELSLLEPPAFELSPLELSPFPLVLLVLPVSELLVLVVFLPVPEPPLSELLILVFLPVGLLPVSEPVGLVASALLPSAVRSLALLLVLLWLGEPGSVVLVIFLPSPVLPAALPRSFLDAVDVPDLLFVPGAVVPAFEPRSFAGASTPVTARSATAFAAGLARSALPRGLLVEPALR